MFKPQETLFLVSYSENLTRATDCEIFWDLEKGCIFMLYPPLTCSRSKLFSVFTPTELLSAAPFVALESKS